MGTSTENLRCEFRNEEYRYAYAEDFLNTWVATQIVTLREQRGLSQARLGELIGTKQPGVSRLEDVNHSTWKTETLKRIARALGVRLKISFETFGSLLNEDAEFSRQFLQRPTFEDDPAFQRRKGPAPATVLGPAISGYHAATDTAKHAQFNAPVGGSFAMIDQSSAELRYATER